MVRLGDSETDHRAEALQVQTNPQDKLQYRQHEGVPRYGQCYKHTRWVTLGGLSTVVA